MTLLEAKLQCFLGSIPIDDLASKISKSAKPHQASPAGVFSLYANEASAALKAIEPFLKRNERILEVGAGLCLFSFFLKKEGYDVIALEPSIAGFDFVAGFQVVLANYFSELRLHVLPCRADELVADRDGRFGLIFSHNVLEHIPNWTTSLLSMLGVMENQGRMVHSCPNYLLPYEPHFGIPVLKIAPDLSRRVYGKRIADRRALWESLNFITYRDVIKFARNNHLCVSFTKGLLHAAISRLGNDKQFRSRHGSLMLILYNFLKYSGLLAVLKRVPPALATPMTFAVTRE